MATFRVNKTKDYTVMSNSHLRDKSMSLKAKGLLSVMLALPDDWDYSIAGLVAISKENQTAIENALDELKTLGYLRVDKILPNKSKSGRIEYEYNVFEQPQKQGVGFLGVEKQGVEILGVENRPQYNTNKSSTNKSNTNNNTALIDEYFESEPVKTAINTWLDYKKENHQTYKPTGLKVLLNRLKKEATDFGDQYVIDEINHSISNNYSGIFAEKNYQKPQKQKFMHHNYDPKVLEQIDKENDWDWENGEPIEEPQQEQNEIAKELAELNKKEFVNLGGIMVAKNVD